MRTFPVCPRCEGRDVVPCDVMLEASDPSESFRASHECRRCHERFRWTAPAEPFNPPRLRGGATT
jgi:hypothetical protein